MRLRPMSDDEYESYLRQLRKEIRDSEQAMKEAREADALKAYETAKTIHDSAVDEIRHLMSIHHPYVPTSWFDKLGKPIRPKQEG